MIIKKVELQGFSSYKNHTVIPVNLGITAIVASYDDNSKRSNAGGKTSIIMSALYALYGEGEYSTLSELVNDKCDSMFVKLFFQLNGNEYIIERGIQKKSSYLDFFENGNRLGKSIDDTQKEINAIMGMDYEMFSSSIFFEQNNMDKFINVGADKRREYVDKVLGLEIWRNLGKEAVKVRKGFEKDFIAFCEERDAIKTVIENIIPAINQKPVIEGELIIKNNNKSELNTIIDKYNESNKNIIKLEVVKNKIKDVDAVISNLNNKLTVEKAKTFDIVKYDIEIEAINKEIEGNKQKLADLEAEHIKLTAEYDELNKSTVDFKVNISKITMEIENQRKHRNHVLSGTCPTCKQVVNTQLLEDENKVIDEVIKKMNDELTATMTLYNEIEVKLRECLKLVGITGTLKNNLSTDIANAEKKQYKLNLDKNQEIENQKKQALIIAGLESEWTVAAGTRTNLEIERDSIKIEHLDVDIKTIQTQVQALDKTINELNIKLGSILSEEKRKVELEEKLEKVKKDIDKAENSVYIYTVLAESYMEIPKKLFFESVALIEEESNKLIQQVLPNISVSIYEDDKKKNNPLVIAFKENGSERSYKRLSGGQKAVVNICIRLAFSLIIMSRAKVSLNFLVLDEVFSALDAENRELVKSIFPVLSSFFKQIILITHTEDLNEFPHLIQVKKSVDGISYI